MFITPFNVVKGIILNEQGKLKTTVWTHAKNCMVHWCGIVKFERVFKSGRARRQIFSSSPVVLNSHFKLFTLQMWPIQFFKALYSASKRYFSTFNKKDSDDNMTA